MATIIRETTTNTDNNGNVVSQVTHEKVFDKTPQEPDYIKIYINMWYNFKDFPQKYRELFLQLALRMSYCNSNEPENSQLVYVFGPQRDDIINSCGWKTDDPLVKGLRELCKCDAIRRVSRGIYQINPSIAGRGAWRFSSKNNRGGIKEFKAYFDLKNGTNSVDVVYDDIDGNGNDTVNAMYVGDEDNADRTFFIDGDDIKINGDGDDDNDD